MADLRLTLGCWDDDRTRALPDGRSLNDMLVSGELDAAVRYSQEQYLCARRLSVEELFVPETLDLPDDSRIP